MSTRTPALPDFPQITDEKVVAAIEAGIECGNLDSDFKGYEGWSFEIALGSVMSALRDADLFGVYRPVLILDHDAGEGTTGGGQVLVTVPDGPTVAGPAEALRHLTEDRDAAGVAGYVAIANVLIGDAALAVANLRAWVTGTPVAP